MTNLSLFSHHATPPPPPPPDITFIPGGTVMSLVHRAGETVIMECPVEDRMLEEGSLFHWERGDQIPIPLERANFTCDNRTLILRNAVSTDDIGRYICMVQEPSGRSFMFSFFLTIFGKFQ